MSYFSYEGRINRKQYFLRTLLLSFLLSVSFNLCVYGDLLHIQWMNSLGALFVVLFSVLMYFNMIKRLHDFGKTGKWIIPRIIVDIGWVIFQNNALILFGLPYIALFFIKGNACNDEDNIQHRQNVQNDIFKNNINLLFSRNIVIAKIIGALFLLGTVIYNNTVYYIGREYYYQDAPIYDLMRIIITIFALWSAKEYYDKGLSLGVWVFLFIAILFNPVMVISFDIRTLEIIDVITAIVFIASIYLERNAKRQNEVTLHKA